MPSLKTYDLFISHAWLYGDDYDNLINLLDKASYFDSRNYSAPKEKPLAISNNAFDYQIKEAIDKKIKPVNCVIILGGMYAHRKWMKYELEAAKKLRKPIIIVAPRGQERMPIELQQYPVVRWNTDSIITAIRQLSR